MAKGLNAATVRAKNRRHSEQAKQRLRESGIKSRRSEGLPPEREFELKNDPKVPYCRSCQFRLKGSLAHHHCRDCKCPCADDYYVSCWTRGCRKQAKLFHDTPYGHLCGEHLELATRFTEHEHPFLVWYRQYREVGPQDMWEEREIQALRDQKELIGAFQKILNDIEG